MSKTALIDIHLTSEFFTPVHSNKIQNILDSATAFANKHGDLYTTLGCSNIVAYITSEAGVPINGYYWHSPKDNFDRSGQWKRVYRSDQETRKNFNYQSILKAGDIVNTFLNGSVQHMYIVTKVFPNGSIETVDNTNPSSRIGRHIIRDANATDVSVYRLDESAATNEEINCLLNWGENSHPALIQAGSRVTSFSNPFRYRYYPKSDSYLGVSLEDNNLYYFEQKIGEIVNLGPVSTWLSSSSCRQ